MTGPVSKSKLVIAFAAVYVIWGSTYLNIRFAIETMPPFLMAAVRFLIAGLFLYAVMRVRGVPRPTAAHWRTSLIVGGLLLLGGNGGVVWAQQVVPSGLAALLVATEPLWIVLLVWLLGEARPTATIVGGVLLGFVGVLLLVGPRNLGGEPVDILGALVIVGAALSWAMGSLYSRHAPQPPNQFLGASMSMLCGGALLLVAGLATGEASRVDVSAMSVKSIAALAYLIVFGSLVAFSAYLWLMKATTPARASTHAYVNPLVAVILGWLLAGEDLSPRVVMAALVIVSGVAAIVSQQSKMQADDETQDARAVPPRTPSAA